MILNDEDDDDDEEEEEDEDEDREFIYSNTRRSVRSAVERCSDENLL